MALFVKGVFFVFENAFSRFTLCHQVQTSLTWLEFVMYKFYVVLIAVFEFLPSFINAF